MRSPLVLLLVAVSAALVARSALALQPSVPPSSAMDDPADSARVRAEIVARGLRVPSALAFLPDGRLLVAERPAGRLSVLDLRRGTLDTVRGVPPVFSEEDGGLLDVVVHPGFARTRWIYYAYSERGDGGATTVVERARLRGTALEGRERLFAARPYVANGEHFGGRLALHRGWLYVTLGDRNLRAFAQDLRAHHGKIVRLHDDGRVPRDNPFVGRADALPEIWSWGHRNPQGLAVHPATGELWCNEHGPKGGDELNVVRRGRNYGWPLVTFGEEYTGGPVGAGLTAMPGMEPPVHHWTPSIAPSGLAFYTGRAFPAWRGSALSGAMALRHLNRVALDGHRVLAEERLLLGRRWRVRAVQQGPDGLVYVGVDSGYVVRLRPAAAPPPPHAATRR